MAEKWTTDDIPDQSGRVAVITGANTGIGYRTAEALTAKGARVILAVRDVTKGDVAAQQIRKNHPGSDVTVAALDLSSLDSIRSAAGSLIGSLGRIDLLINNAGVMWTPEATTADGFELQFGTNHLGHFAFTGLLLPLILATDRSRVVTISSLAHDHRPPKTFEDINRRGGYDKMVAYSQSKLANLLFTYEFQRRLETHGASTTAIAAHPGIARTDLARDYFPVWARITMAAVGQPVDLGALPTLRAATDPSSRGGQYWGPAQLGGRRGHPTLVRSNPQSHNADWQRRLWDASESLTGVTYGV